MSGIIGYEELFNFQDDSQFSKALADIAKFAEQYDKASKSVRESLSEIQTANKSMAESILTSNEKLSGQNEQNRVEIINQAKAADLLTESNKKLVKTQEELFQADVAFENQMRKITASMSTNEQEVGRLKVELEQLAKSQKISKSLFEDGQVKQSAYIKVTAENSAKQRELKTRLQELEGTLKANNKEVQRAYTSYDQMDLSMKRLQKDYKLLSEEERDNVEVGGQMLKQIAEYDAKLKAIDETMGAHNREVGNYKKATNGLKIEMRETVAAMAQMQMEGKQGSAEYQAMAEKAGNLRNQLDDVRAEIKMLASDTRAFDTLIQAAEGVTAAFGVAQAGAALLGVEDEKLQKSMQKLQAVMVALQSLQSIQNIIQKESAVYQSVTLLQKKAQVLYTNLETAAESKNIVVKYAAVSAQWALNAAMYANPVVLILAAFVALTAVFLAFALSADSASESQSKLNEAQKISIERTERQFELTQQGNKQRVKDLEGELALMKAKGVSQSEINKKELELLRIKSDMANSSKGWYADEIASLNTNKAKLNELKATLESYNQAKSDDRKIEVIVDYKTGETKRKKVDEEDIKAVEGMISNLTTITERSQGIIDQAAQSSLDVQTKLAEDKKALAEQGLKSESAAIEAQLLAVKKGTAQEYNLKLQAIEAERRQALNAANLTEGEISKINAKALDDRKKATEDYNKTILEDQLFLLNTNLLGVKKNSEKEFDLKKKQIQKELEISLNGSNISDAQRKFLTAKANKDIEDLARDHANKILTIGLENQITIKQAEITSALEGSQARYELEIQLQDQLLELEKNRINSSLDLNEAQKSALLMKAEAETNAAKKSLTNQIQLADINKQKNKAATDEAMARMNLEFISNNGSIEQRKAAQAKLVEMNKTHLDTQLNDLENLHKMGLISEADYLSQKNDLTLKSEEERLAILSEKADQEKQIRQSITSVGVELINMAFDYAKSMSEKQIQNLQTQMEYEKGLAGDNAKQKEAIEAKYQKKIREEKRKAAITEKFAAMFQASVNTALAVTSALATKPFLPLGPIMAALAGTMGLAQVAFIAAKPLPAFAKGTKNAPRGFAWVGEQGTELKEDRFGNYSLTSNRASIDYLKGGEKIYTAQSPETRFFRSILKGGASEGNTSATFNLNEISARIAGMKEDKDRRSMFEMFSRTNLSELKKAFRESVGEIPITENNWDEKGFTTYLNVKNTRIQRMNNRFKTGGNG